MPYVEYDEVEATCSECGRMFRSEEALTAHRSESHPPGGPTAGGTKSPSRVPCSVCKETFTTVAALGRHNQRSHTS